MTDEEKRLHIVYVQQMRQSPQTFKAEVKRQGKTKTTKGPVDLSELNDIL